MSGKEKGKQKAVQGTLMPATPCKIDLRNANAIRREMAAVYRDMRSSKIEKQDGTRLAYVLNMLRMAYETSVLEDRIKQLEDSHESKSTN